MNLQVSTHAVGSLNQGATQFYQAFLVLATNIQKAKSKRDRSHFLLGLGLWNDDNQMKTTAWLHHNVQTPVLCSQAPQKGTLSQPRTGEPNFPMALLCSLHEVMRSLQGRARVLWVENRTGTRILTELPAGPARRCTACPAWFRVSSKRSSRYVWRVCWSAWACDCLLTSRWDVFQNARVCEYCCAPHLQQLSTFCLFSQLLSRWLAFFHTKLISMVDWTQEASSQGILLNSFTCQQSSLVTLQIGRLKVWKPESWQEPLSTIPTEFSAPLLSLLSVRDLLSNSKVSLSTLVPVHVLLESLSFGTGSGAGGTPSVKYTFLEQENHGTVDKKTRLDTQQTYFLHRSDPK